MIENRKELVVVKESRIEEEWMMQLMTQRSFVGRNMEREINRQCAYLHGIIRGLRCVGVIDIRVERAPG